MPALRALRRIASTVAAADPDTPVLELRGITKRFPGVLANDHVDLDLRRGEVHALLGENGAGKSTLMNILYGLYQPDEGEILLHGKPAEISSPHGAIAAGIGMVHQHFMLIPVMTVAENIVLASEPRRNGVLLDTAAAERRVRELAEQFSFHIDPHARVRDITVGQQQRVEILKALYRGADILILDEPTAVLTPQEAVELFEILEAPRRGGDVGHLHLAQAERGARDRRPHHRAAARGQGRHDRARGRDRGGPRADDGRPRRAAARRQDGAESGRRAPRRRRPPRPRRPWSRSGARRLLQRAGRRDRRDRRRRRQRPDRADRRDHRAAQVELRHGHRCR